jgi:uncharacterized membrane protein YjjP (DUF1212 family)
VCDNCLFFDMFTSPLVVPFSATNPSYPLWVQQLSYGVCGASCSLLFFGGSFEDAGLAAIGGLIVGGICLIGSK